MIAWYSLQFRGESVRYLPDVISYEAYAPCDLRLETIPSQVTQSSHWILKPLFYLFAFMTVFGLPALALGAARQPDPFASLLILALVWPIVAGVAYLFHYMRFTRYLRFTTEGVEVVEERRGKTSSWTARPEEYSKILYGFAKPFNAKVYDKGCLAFVILVHPAKDKSIMLYCRQHHFKTPDIGDTKQRADHYGAFFGLPAEEYR